MEIRESTYTENKESRIDQVHTIAYSKSHRDNGVIQARGKIDDEANTLSTGDGCTNQSTGNYVFTKEEDMSDIDVVAHDGSKYESNGRIYGDAGIAPCIGARDFKDPKKVATLENPNQPIIRIRKLTPVETERLQGYPDQLNPIYLSYEYHDWYRNGMTTKKPCPELPIGFKAEWRYKILRKIRKPEGVTLHVAIL